MKASDIKQLKPFGNYHVDVELKRLYAVISDWILEDHLLMEPDFQRGHVWTKRQQQAFVEFILKGGKTSPFLFNHPGWMKTFEGEFVCVDGLQRITALTKFLSNDLPVFDGHIRSGIEGIDQLLQRIFVQVYINDLPTRKDVLEWYIELNSGGTPHSPKEIARVKKLLEQE